MNLQLFATICNYLQLFATNLQLITINVATIYNYLQLNRCFRRTTDYKKAPRCGHISNQEKRTGQPGKFLNQVAKRKLKPRNLREPGKL